MPVPPMSRRSLLTGSGLAVVAGIAGYAVARGSDAASAKAPGSAANGYGAPAGSSRKVFAKLSQLTGAGVVTNGLVLTRDPAGAVHALSATCTHQGCTVGSPAAGVVTCPCHGSQFDASTGAVRRGPATRPLPTVAVSVVGDEIVGA